MPYPTFSLHRLTILCRHFGHFGPSGPTSTILRHTPRWIDPHPTAAKSTTRSVNFLPSNGLVMYKDRIFVPSVGDLRQRLLTEFHDSTIGGHSGVSATAARLEISFYWSRLLTDVKAYIKHYATCQSVKYITQRPSGTLQPLPVPHRVWEDLSIDFITHLPVSANKTVIWVVVDRLTKYAHFVGLPSKFTAAYLVGVFSQVVFRLHGLPHSIVSDRDRIFLSDFWSELFQLSGTTLVFSTAYHPQIDGKTEVLNRVLGTYLRCFVVEEPKNWGKFLHLAEYWYNTSQHTSIGMSPFRALYGRQPPSLIHYLSDGTDVAAVDDLVSHQRRILFIVKFHLGRARQWMKSLADAHRQERTFATGDWVLLRLQPYRQQSVQGWSSHKLSKRYFGPFRVIRRIRAVAYELGLPVGARIHPVFHVLLLRPFHGTPPENYGSLPPKTMGVSPFRRSMQILGRRAGSSTSQPQVLVQWEGQEEADASWVSLSDFSAAHPDFDLEGKVQLEREGNDTVQTTQAPIASPISPRGNSSGPIDSSTDPEEDDSCGPAPRRSTRVKQQLKYLLDYYYGMRVSKTNKSSY
ncbi:UNVERIFIED_CONTAM: hypothetical protein Slati_2941500 [Sesamum latifolium]|uniref:Integrase catalytic domain-containing protein n=1 Tax=Sesamum latifolium TaxID=2727402 RepID=A0AAW2VHJ2_9LAMI